MKTTLLLTLLFSLYSLATPKISKIDDGEFNMDGPACWLLNSKSEVVFYDDLKTGKIKLDSKILSLNRSSGKFESDFFTCGNKYEYQSEDKSTFVTINMNSSKTKKCHGKMIVKVHKAKTTLTKLKSECGE